MKMVDAHTSVRLLLSLVSLLLGCASAAITSNPPAAAAPAPASAAAPAAAPELERLRDLLETRREHKYHAGDHTALTMRREGGSKKVPQSSLDQVDNKPYLPDAVHYNIKVKGSGHYLREDDTSDAVVKCTNLGPENNDEYAVFRMITETDGNYRIKVLGSEHYFWQYIVDNEVRGTTTMADRYTSFTFEPNSDFSYRIKVLGSGHFLHEDTQSGALAGWNVSQDDTASFILEALDTTAPCEDYQFQAACPPDRCNWYGTTCKVPDPSSYGLHNSANMISATLSSVVFALLCASLAVPLAA